MNGQQMRRVVDLCRPTGASLRTLPGVDSLIDGKVTVNQLAEVAIEDLLGRDPVNLDTDAIEDFIRDRVVLVTGAGGSIGSELCKQICRFSRRRRCSCSSKRRTTSSRSIARSLRGVQGPLDRFPTSRMCAIRARLEAIFDTEDDRPWSSSAAAAHKHVPMMESNPGEAIKNNVFGTKKVADTAHRLRRRKIRDGLDRQKAVNPTSVMERPRSAPPRSTCKRCRRRSKTHFLAVRFGNVLDSAGSVIPIFKQQGSRRAAR